MSLTLARIFWLVTLIWKNVIRRKLDRTGKTEVRTYRGATVRILSDIIEKSTQVYPQVEKITICIGTNDCSRGEVNEARILENVDHLTTVIKNIFPHATLNFLAIPPTKNPEANQIIKKINRHLKKCVLDRGALFRDCNTLWYHVNPDGTVDKGLLVDTVHLSDWGLRLLLQNVVPFFYTLQFDQRYTKPANNYQMEPRSTPPDYISTIENFPQLQRKDTTGIPTSYFTSQVDYLRNLSTLETMV